MRLLPAMALLMLTLTATAFADPAPEHEAQRKQATAAFEASNWQQVIGTCSTILTANPQDNFALHLRGTARIELGIATVDAAQIRGGIADTRAAISAASSPEFNYYLPYLYGMTHLSRLEGQNSHAEVAVSIANQLLQTADITAEQKANVHYQRGLANGIMKQTDAAVQDFRAAIAAQPKHLASFLAMADTLGEAGRTEDALKAFQETITAFPEEPIVYNNLGMFHQTARRYNDALRAFTAALQKDSKYFIALTNRGFTWLEGGKPADAEKDFSASLQMEPNQLAVYGMRGTAKLVQGRWQEALQDFDVVVKQNPDDGSAHADAGYARFFGKDYAGAIAEFDQAIEKDPEARFVNPWRCWTLLKLNRNAEAAAIAQASRQKTDEQRDWIDFVILFHMGDLSANDLLNKIDRTNTDMQTAQLCEARFFIGEHQLRAGQNQEAGTSYQQALQTNKRQLSAWRGASYALKRFQ